MGHEERRDMLTEEIKQSLDQYIKDNYMDRSLQKTEIVCRHEITKSSGDHFSKKESFTLDQLMDEVGESFHEMLFAHIDMSGTQCLSPCPKKQNRIIQSNIKRDPYSHVRWWCGSFLDSIVHPL